MICQEEIAAVICDWQMKPGFDDWNAKVAALVADLAALIRPAFEAKERDALRRETRALAQAQDWRNEAEKAERRALSAEAKLAQAVEEIDAAKEFGMGFHADCVTEATRDFYRARARARAAAAMGEKT